MPRSKRLLIGLCGLLWPVLTVAGASTPQSGPPALTLVADCGDGISRVLRLEGDKGWLFLPEGGRMLRRQGDAWVGEGWRVRVRGERIELQGSDAQLRCRNDRRRAVWEAARLDGVGFRAVGNEPGWVLELRGGKAHLLTDYGQRELGWSLGPPEVDVKRGLTRWQGGDMVVELRPGSCRDSMSGEAFETRVRIEGRGLSLSGCGRALH